MTATREPERTTAVAQPAPGELQAPDQVAITLAGIAGAQLTAAQIGAAVEHQTELQLAMLGAIQNPRDEATAFQKISAAVEVFATAKRAEYSWTQSGEQVAGPTVYLARLMRDRWGHVRSGFRIVDATGDRAIVRGFAWDLQSGAAAQQDREVSMLIKRKVCGGCNQRPDDCRGSGCTHRGLVTRWVPPTSRERTLEITKEGSKAERNCLVSILPDDRVQRVLAVARETVAKEADQDAAGFRDRLLIKFDRLGIPAAELEAWLGCELAKASGRDLADLAAVWSGVRAGDVDWREELARRGVEVEASADPVAEPVRRQPDEAPEEALGREAKRGEVQSGQVDPGAAALEEVAGLEDQRPDWSALDLPALRKAAAEHYGRKYKKGTKAATIVADLEALPWPPVEQPKPKRREVSKPPNAIGAEDLEAIEATIAKAAAGDQALADTIRDRVATLLCVAEEMAELFGRGGCPGLEWLPASELDWFRGKLESIIKRAKGGS